MKIFEFFNRMIIFNSLIEQYRTGTPDEFAARLKVSRTSLYSIIDELRAQGVEIGYSRTRCTFYYKNPVSLEIQFTIKKFESMTDTDMQNITGGHENFLFRTFWRTETCYFCI